MMTSVGYSVDEYLTVAQLRALLAVFPDDAYVSLVMRDESGICAVDSAEFVADGSAKMNASHVYIYGESFNHA